MPTTVVHGKKAPCDVYIGRPSPWGNPFAIGRDGTREAVIVAYRQWIVQQPHLLEQIPQLRDKVLCCWCAPQACHGGALSELAALPDRQLEALIALATVRAEVKAGPG